MGKSARWRRQDPTAGHLGGQPEPWAGASLADRVDNAAQARAGGGVADDVLLATAVEVSRAWAAG